MINKVYLNSTNPLPKTLPPPPPPPKLTVKTKMVKVRIIEYDVSHDYYDVDESDIFKDISDWNVVSEEDYHILCRFLNVNNSKHKMYCIAKQIEDIQPLFDRVMSEAKETIKKESECNKKRKERATKSAKTKAIKKQEKELVLLAELKAKYE